MVAVRDGFGAGAVNELLCILGCILQAKVTLKVCRIDHAVVEAAAVFHRSVVVSIVEHIGIEEQVVTGIGAWEEVLVMHHGRKLTCKLVTIVVGCTVADQTLPRNRSGAEFVNAANRRSELVHLVQRGERRRLLGISSFLSVPVLHADSATTFHDILRSEFGLFATQRGIGRRGCFAQSMRLHHLHLVARLHGFA